MKRGFVRRIFVGLWLLLPVTMLAQPLPKTYTVIREAGYATSLSLIITGSDGRIIRGNYIFELRDTATRTARYAYSYGIGANGVQTEKAVPAGVYDLIDVRTDRPFLRNVVVQHGKRNSVSTSVAMGKLLFQTEDNPALLPMGFVAKVLPMYADGDTLVQSTSDTGTYLPGEYFVEVNTIPPSRYRVDIDWDTVTVIELGQSGELQLGNKGSAIVFSLHRPHAGAYEKLQELHLGEKTDTSLSIKPGQYELRYSVPMPGGRTQARRKFFEIIAGTTTKLELE